MLVISGELTDLNQHIKALSGNRFAGGALKKKETERVYWECKEQKIAPIKKYPIKIQFKWYSKDKRKDIDNVAFGKKFILDGMVMAGVLEGDGRKFINGFTDEFYIDSENPRTEISYYENRTKN